MASNRKADYEHPYHFDTPALQHARIQIEQRKMIIYRECEWYHPELVHDLFDESDLMSDEVGIYLASKIRDKKNRQGHLLKGGISSHDIVVWHPSMTHEIATFAVDVDWVESNVRVHSGTFKGVSKVVNRFQRNWTAQYPDKEGWLEDGIESTARAIRSWLEINYNKYYSTGETDRLYK